MNLCKILYFWYVHTFLVLIPIRYSDTFFFQLKLFIVSPSQHLLITFIPNIAFGNVIIYCHIDAFITFFHFIKIFYLLLFFFLFSILLKTDTKQK